MRAPRPPLFVAPRIYRLRRLRDAARMLPFFGAVLILLPLLHSPGPAARPPIISPSAATQPPAAAAPPPAPLRGRSTAGDGIYIFGIWALLILIARQLAPGLEDEGSARDDGSEG